jgi:hypothetical protein
MSQKPCIEMHCEDTANAGLLLSHGVNGCGFSIGRAQCNSALYVTRGLEMMSPVRSSACCNLATMLSAVAEAGGEVSPGALQ